MKYQLTEEAVKDVEGILEESWGHNKKNRSSMSFYGKHRGINYSAHPYASPLRGLREKLFQTIFSAPTSAVFSITVPDVIRGLRSRLDSRQ